MYPTSLLLPSPREKISKYFTFLEFRKLFPSPPTFFFRSVFLSLYFHNFYLLYTKLFPFFLEIQFVRTAVRPAKLGLSQPTGTWATQYKSRSLYRSIIWKLGLAWWNSSTVIGSLPKGGKVWLIQSNFQITLPGCDAGTPLFHQRSLLPFLSPPVPELLFNIPSCVSSVDFFWTLFGKVLKSKLQL